MMNFCLTTKTKYLIREAADFIFGHSEISIAFKDEHRRLTFSPSQSKMEYDRLIALIGKKQVPEAGIKVRWRGGGGLGGVSLAQRRDFIHQLLSLSGEAPPPPTELNPKEFQGFQLALLNKVLLLLLLYTMMVPLLEQDVFIIRLTGNPPCLWYFCAGLV